jgi:type IV pilus assembly protein PilB
MDIADRMRPQDGRLAVSIEGRERYLRVSTIPTHFGEKMVLRVLDPRSIFIEMDRLFLVDAVRDAVRVMSGQPQGMVIVAGPTGSGKTTTIYSLIHQRCADEVNIVTIEDPIEYTIEGTAQVQVNEAQEVTFAGAIRSFLRQDPDIMLVGETRDSLTARASIEAALTGHLVFTSLHANDALGCILRLKEMGIEPFMVAHTLHGVISQRLVRRICPKCRQPQPYDRALLAPLGVLPDDQRDTMVPLFRGRGCSECNFLGYKGRLGVYEVLRVSDELRPLIAAGRDLSELRPFCVDRGLLWPLRDYAYYLLTAGFTTPEEVLRMLFTDEGGE